MHLIFNHCSSEVHLVCTGCNSKEKGTFDLHCIYAMKEWYCFQQQEFLVISYYPALWSPTEYVHVCFCACVGACICEFGRWMRACICSCVCVRACVPLGCFFLVCVWFFSPPSSLCNPLLLLLCVGRRVPTKERKCLSVCAHCSCNVEGAVMLHILCRKYVRTTNRHRPNLYFAVVKELFKFWH